MINLPLIFIPSNVPFTRITMLFKAVFYIFFSLKSGFDGLKNIEYISLISWIISLSFARIISARASAIFRKMKFWIYNLHKVLYKFELGQEKSTIFLARFLRRHRVRVCQIRLVSCKKKGFHLIQNFWRGKLPMVRVCIGYNDNFAKDERFKHFKFFPSVWRTKIKPYFSIWLPRKTISTTFLCITVS